jgi:uncharacterized protein (TIGR02466 family)
MERAVILFATHVLHAPLPGGRDLNPELAGLAQSLAADDAAGVAWCEANAYPGYTSYGSLNDLPWRFPAFAVLREALQPLVDGFAAALELDLAGRPLLLDSLWVNVLAPGGFHSGHIHPHSVISGTYYVQTPPGSAALKLEDPRLPLMMAAPPRRAEAALERRSFVYLTPQAGEVVLWESWLRHEVPLHDAQEDRISVSFNYRWGA